VAAFSFHETKNIQCGEGGALAVNNPDWVERAEFIRDKGTNRSQFLKGLVDKYTWVEVGGSYVPSEICSAFLCAQLELMDEISERRRRIFTTYREHLEPLRAEGLIGIPRIPEECRTNFHLFFVILRDAATRDELLAHLRKRDIHAVFHYVPLHTSPMGLKFGYGDGSLLVTEDMSARLVRLPFFHGITEDEQMRVIEAVTEFVRGTTQP
jgi:dTDP-4-amino-4,6-dideoxygalactose transaminase